MSNTHHESTVENNNTDLTWFGRQLQPTSIRSILKFYLSPIAYKITNTIISLNRGTQYMMSSQPNPISHGFIPNNFISF